MCSTLIFVSLIYTLSDNSMFTKELKILISYKSVGTCGIPYSLIYKTEGVWSLCMVYTKAWTGPLYTKRITYFPFGISHMIFGAKFHKSKWNFEYMFRIFGTVHDVEELKIINFPQVYGVREWYISLIIERMTSFTFTIYSIFAQFLPLTILPGWYGTSWTKKTVDRRSQRTRESSYTSLTYVLLRIFPWSL